MKKITTLAIILTILSFTSCQKKSVEPATPTTGMTPTSEESIDVQYRVTSASGHFNVQYTSFENDKITTTNVEVKKLACSYSFHWTTKQKLSIKAYNYTASTKDILVEIYVNGVLFKSGVSNTSGGIAVAEGVYTK